MEVVNAVKHYQRNIEKCSGNEERMLHCLQKLYRLPVTVQHLQETGVGRTVNALRKYEGDTGEAAKALVNKWKAMVAEADSSDEEVSKEKYSTGSESPPKISVYRHNSSHSEVHKDENSSEKDNTKDRNHRSREYSDKDGRSNRKSSHSDHGHKRHHDREYNKTEDKRRKISSEEESISEDEVEEQQVYDNGHEPYDGAGNEESDHVSAEDSDRRKEESENEANEVSDAENNHSDVQGSDSSDAEEKSSVNRKHKPHSVSNSDVSRSSANIHEKNHKRSTHHSHNGESSKNRCDERRDKSSKSTNKSSTYPNNHESNRKVEINSENSSKSRNRSNSVCSSKDNKLKGNEKERYNEKGKVKDDVKDRVKFEEKKNHARSEEIKLREKTEEKRERSKPEEKRERSKSDEKRERSKLDEKKGRGKADAKKESEKTEERKGRVKPEEKKKEVCKTTSRKDSKTESNIRKEETKVGSASSKTSATKSFRKDKSSNSKQTKVSTEGNDGIDSFSGTSFADALGMMGTLDVVNKKKKRPSAGSGSSSKKAEESSNKRGSSASSSSKHVESKPQKSSPLPKMVASDDVNLLDPSLKLVPLDQFEMEVDVDASLPAINPNYRPLPHFNLDTPSRSRGKSLTEEEALCQVMSTKNQRTKVYSGVKTNKSWATVPTLFEICIRVLQENIDALEYTGGVPYDLLKPVLIHATPEQLFNLEHYNPYLVEDTDEIWESHVQRKFRNKSRLDMETYREMYQRCVEESEAKLKALTQNIQNSMAKSLPVRQTKLAYVDSIAKPPRQVARKQAKFGTANATATTPMAKVQKLASPSPSSSSPVIHVPTPRASQSAKVKPRMAPLMMKTMKLAKSFKR